MELNKQEPALKALLSYEKLNHKIYLTSLYAGFFTIVKNEKNHLKNDDKTKKKRIFG